MDIVENTNTAIVRDKAKANALISRVVASITSLKAELHQAVVTSIWHYGKYGDTRLLDRLYQAMPHNMRQSLVAYVSNINREVGIKLLDRKTVEGTARQQSEIRQAEGKPEEIKKAREKLVSLADKLAETEGTWKADVTGNTQSIKPFYENPGSIKATLTIYKDKRVVQMLESLEALARDGRKGTDVQFSPRMKRFISEALTKAKQIADLEGTEETAEEQADTKATQVRNAGVVAAANKAQRKTATNKRMITAQKLAAKGKPEVEAHSTH